jgi:hypothetical protein
MKFRLQILPYWRFYQLQRSFTSLEARELFETHKGFVSVLKAGCVYLIASQPACDRHDLGRPAAGRYSTGTAPRFSTFPRLLASAALESNLTPCARSRPLMTWTANLLSQNTPCLMWCARQMNLRLKRRSGIREGHGPPILTEVG